MKMFDECYFSRCNLSIESLQDTATYAEKNQQVGASGMYGAGGGGSVNYAKSNYASVTEQSGIKAGDGGFQVNVQGNTDLKGATIAGSSDASKNTVTTNTLTTSDIKNLAPKMRCQRTKLWPSKTSRC